jgi:hypothetical protein
MAKPKQTIDFQSVVDSAVEGGTSKESLVEFFTNLIELINESEDAPVEKAAKGGKAAKSKKSKEPAWAEGLDETQLGELAVAMDLASKAAIKKLGGERQAILDLFEGTDDADVEEQIAELFGEGEEGEEGGETLSLEDLEDDQLRQLAVEMELTDEKKSAKMTTKKLLALFEDADEDEVAEKIAELFGEGEENTLALEDLDLAQLRELAVEMDLADGKKAAKMKKDALLVLFEDADEDEVSEQIQTLFGSGDDDSGEESDEDEEAYADFTLEELRTEAVRVGIEAKKLKGIKDRDVLIDMIKDAEEDEE